MWTCLAAALPDRRILLRSVCSFSASPDTQSLVSVLDLFPFVDIGCINEPTVYLRVRVDVSRWISPAADVASDTFTSAETESKTLPQYYILWAGVSIYSTWLIIRMLTAEQAVVWSCRRELNDTRVGCLTKQQTHIFTHLTNIGGKTYLNTQYQYLAPFVIISTIV